MRIFQTTEMLNRNVNAANNWVRVMLSQVAVTCGPNVVMVFGVSPLTMMTLNRAIAVP